MEVDDRQTQLVAMLDTRDATRFFGSRGGTARAQPNRTPTRVHDIILTQNISNEPE